MDIKSLHEVNSEYFSKRRSKTRYPKSAVNAAFWICVVLIIVAVLSFNYNSFLTRPVFGYSLYLSEGENNLMLVKNAEDFDPSLTAESIYQNGPGQAISGVCSNSHKTVEIGIVKATYPNLGKALAFLIGKAHILVIAAVLWIVTVLVLDSRARNRVTHRSMFGNKGEVRK